MNATPPAPGLTISEAARLWGVHRDTVKRWVKGGVVDAHQGNDGAWRIREGQSPPPSYSLRAASGQSPGVVREHATGQPQGSPAPDPELALVRASLAEAERALAAAQREVEVLREGLADARAERDRLHELLRNALDRPSLIERLVFAIRERWDRRGL